MIAPSIAANRHERRRRAVIGEVQKLRVDQLTGFQCGWKGCDAHYEGEVLPPGWSVLIVHDTSKAPIEIVGGETMLSLDRLKWRHDKMLCPTHAKALDDLLHQGAGEADPLSKTAGEA